MGLTSIVIGLFLAFACVGGAVQLWRIPAARLGLLVLAGLCLLAGLALSSVRYVGANEVGLVTKNALGPALTGGRIVATDGEMGVQAETLAPGWHLGYWPVIFNVDTRPLIEVGSGQVGLVTARDGEPLDPGQLFAPEVSPTEFKKMVEDANYFLSGTGRKGTQSNVLTPGKYRINPELFEVELVNSTDVSNATVAVLKANFGTEPSIERSIVEGEETVTLADTGEKGVRAQPLPPGKYPINTKAFEVTTVSTRETILRFTSAQGVINQSQRSTSANAIEEREITVRTSDGFTFPVDVRVEYKIDPANAPLVVAKLGSDGQPLLSKMNSAVRAIFRNNAESVKALDYVNQRSQQESQSLVMLQSAMQSLGVSILAVRIGDVGDEESLGNLLATQRDREIALQEQETFKEQQRAAEQEKELTRTQQEAEEERRLATARYEVQIAEQAKEQRIIAARAEAESIQIQAEAQAEAFRQIAEQIGAGNAALIEVLKVVGENSIEITPRVMVSGGGTSNSGEMTALIGTMLDSMVSRQAVEDDDEQESED